MRFGADPSINSDDARASDITDPIVLGAGAAVTAIDQMMTAAINAARNMAAAQSRTADPSRRHAAPGGTLV